MKKYLILALLLSGCASSSQTYAPDGGQAYSLNCSGTVRNWGMCEQKAGDICKEKGYKVLSTMGDNGIVVTANSSGAYASSTHSRTMLITCNK